MGVIFDLYYGKMEPLCERKNNSSEYVERVEKLLKIEEYLIKQYPDIEHLLDDYKQANADITDIIGYEEFLKGYKFGIGMIMAAIEV